MGTMQSLLFSVAVRLGIFTQVLVIAVLVMIVVDVIIILGILVSVLLTLVCFIVVAWRVQVLQVTW